MNASRKRVVSPVLFLLVFVLFTMPFFSVSCQGQTVKTFTGYDIAAGNTKLDVGSLGLPSGGTTSGGGGGGSGSGTNQVLMVLVLLVAAAGVALPFVPLKMKDPFLIPMILGAAGVALLAAFAFMAPAEVAEQSQKMAEGKAEIGLWLTLLAMAGAAGYSFYLRGQRVDASKPLDFRGVFAAAPAAAPPAPGMYAPGQGYPPAYPPPAPQPPAYQPPAAPQPPAPQPPAVRACPNCGGPVGPADAFCQTCGTTMGGAQSAPPAPPAQP